MFSWKRRKCAHKGEKKSATSFFVCSYQYLCQKYFFLLLLFFFFSFFFFSFFLFFSPNLSSSRRKPSRFILTNEEQSEGWAGDVFDTFTTHTATSVHSF